MSKCAAIIIAAVLFGALVLKASDVPEGNAIYDPSPNHLWNRLNETLFVRTAQDGKKYGLDELDILYWLSTTNLLSGTSHQRALSVLDKFINTHGERLVQDPLKKALLQRDLWALFDWSAFEEDFNHVPERKELQKRLAIAIRRLALTTNEIASLPDNYAQAEKNHLPDLPRGLFQTNGDWINVVVNGAELTVPAHVRGFGGRSVFAVLFHDADGRQAGMDYLKRLGAVRPMFVTVTNRDFQEELQLNPNLPQFPANSQWALARRMCVIDTEGRIRLTHVIESIQMRTYLNYNRFYGVARLDSNRPQHFNEFRMSRDAQADLISVAQDEGGFTSNNRFFSMGFDPFEMNRAGQTNQDAVTYQTRVLGNCMECHFAPGIFSVNSFTRFLSGGPTFQTTQMVGFDLGRDALETVNWKQRQFDWGLLQGLWIQEN